MFPPFFTLKYYCTYKIYKCIFLTSLAFLILSTLSNLNCFLSTLSLILTVFSALSALSALSLLSLLSLFSLLSLILIVLSNSLCSYIPIISGLLMFVCSNSVIVLYCIFDDSRSITLLPPCAFLTTGVSSITLSSLQNLYDFS